MLYFDPIDMMVTVSFPNVSLSFQKTPLNKNFDPFLVLVVSEKSLLGPKHVSGKCYWVQNMSVENRYSVQNVSVENVT